MTKELKKTIGVYLENELIERIDVLAKKDGKSKNGMINDLLGFAVQHYENYIMIDEQLDEYYKRCTLSGMEHEGFKTDPLLDYHTEVKSLGYRHGKKVRELEQRISNPNL